MNTIAFLLTAALATAGLQASATADAAVRDALGREWIPIEPARLASMRGGMQLPSGLALSFGIERLVYVNGDLVASATLHIADISRMTSDEALSLAAVNDGMVVRLGEGNRIDPVGTGVLLIQNTLDGQDIRALTTLDVGVGTLGMLQEMNTYGALQSAVANAAGGP